MTSAPAPPEGWVEQIIIAGDHEVVIHLPPDPFAEDLIDMEVYEASGELPYWAELWPSAKALARALPGRPLHGRKVLELGAGVALPGIVAAKEGAKVTITDLQPDANDAARHNAQVNGVSFVAEIVADWREPQVLLDAGPFDLVIGADLLYEEYHAPTLLDLLVKLDAPVLLGDQGRRTWPAFHTLAQEVFEIESRQDPDLTVASVHELRRR